MKSDEKPTNLKLTYVNLNKPEDQAQHELQRTGWLGEGNVIPSTPPSLLHHPDHQEELVQGRSVASRCRTRSRR